MGRIFVIVVLLVFSMSCADKKEVSSLNPIDWDKRTIALKTEEGFESGTTYLSVYSQIYSLTEFKTHDLTATISIRNANRSDTIYIQKAQYYGTKGELIRTYFDKTIFLRPMETVEIVIDETDKEGGTGANFIFDWLIAPNSNEPIIEGVMISTSGQQGLSFTTQGKRLKK
jgi:hypothetical protein